MMRAGPAITDATQRFPARVYGGTDPHVEAPTAMEIPPRPDPTITVVIVLSSAELAGERWDGFIKEIRTSLDLHATFHHETFSCGSEGTRRAVWYVEVKSGAMPELQEDMRYHAGYLRGRGPAGRLVWAPASPIDL